MTVSLIPGNTRTLYIGKQAAQGTAQTTPTVKLRVTDCQLDPGRQHITLPESDVSTQQPADAVVGAEPGGQFTCWLRPNDNDLLLLALQGATADSGAGNYTHSLTPTQATPYLTIYEVIPTSSLVTQYVDCRVTSATFTGSAGQGISAQYTVQGLSAVLGASAPSAPAAYTTDRPLVYPDVTVTRNSVHNGDVDAFSLTVDRGGQYFHGDNGLAAADYVNGLYGVTGSMLIAFQNDQEYRGFNTGATNGTTLTTSLYAVPLTVAAAIDSNTSVTWTMTSINLTAFPVGMATDGSPVTVQSTFRTPPATTWSNNLTISVKNQKATPTS